MKPTQRIRVIPADCVASIASQFAERQGDTVKVYPEQSHGFGSTGFVRLGYGNPTWAKGVSKPFGTPFKPKRPDCSGPVLYATGSKSDTLTLETTGKGQMVCNPGTKFDEAAHFTKVAETTVAIQKRLERVFAKARVRIRRQIAPKAKETAKERVLGLKEIPVNPGFKVRLPEFLTRNEVRSDDGAIVPRSKVERTEPVQWTPPSNGGRAGRIERWGE